MVWSQWAYTKNPFFFFLAKKKKRKEENQEPKIIEPMR